MPHRDDHEAARARIEALERELAESKARAAQDLAEARAQAAPRGSEARPELPREAADRPWPAANRRTYLRSVALVTALLDALVVLRFALWPVDEASAEDPTLVGWVLAPFVLLPVCYVLARRTRAPHPSSVVGVGIIATTFGAVGNLGAMGVEWPEAIAAPPWRWMTQLGIGALTILVHGAALSSWTADAVLTEDTGSD